MGQSSEPSHSAIISNPPHVFSLRLNFVTAMSISEAGIGDDRLRLATKRLVCMAYPTVATKATASAQ